MPSVASHLPIEALQSTGAYRQIDRKLHRKSLRRRVVRYGLLGFNAVLLLSVLTFIVVGQRSSTPSTSLLHNSALAASSSRSVANPLDQISSADIAFNVASMSALPETTAVANQAASVNLELMTSTPTTASIVSKPQVVATALKSNKDIKTYVVAGGDTVATIAAKFNVTSDSIKWSNNLRSDVVAAGQSLMIPPEGVSGIVYTVKAGDTPDSLASKYKASKDEIIAYNDAEITGLKVGERIIIANGSIATTPVAVASSSSWGGLAWGGAAIYGFNGYDFGNCTWYVATQIAVPANWGNAATWAAGARASGWQVSSTPTVGAIAQTPYSAGGLGHVAIVDGISPDGSQVLIRDMNGIAGFNHVGKAWQATSHYVNYITH